MSKPPASPFEPAAAGIVARRLKAVEKGLSAVGRSPDPDDIRPETIHQLRVALRRAAAAAGSFPGLFERPRRLRRLARDLKKIRRVIGEARSCDVGIELLRHDRRSAPDEDREAYRTLIRVLRRRRERSLGRLEELADRCTPGQVRRLRKRIGRRAEREACGAGAGSFALAAASALRHHLGAVVESAPGIDGGYEQLHTLRLAGKRLRYATEVFRPCFSDDDAEEAQTRLIAMQDGLGAINDLCEIVELIDGHAARLRARKGDDHPLLRPLARLRAGYEQRRDEARRRFTESWRAAGEADLLRVYSRMLASLCADESGGGARPGGPAASRPDHAMGSIGS